MSDTNPLSSAQLLQSLQVQLEARVEEKFAQLKAKIVPARMNDALATDDIKQLVKDASAQAGDGEPIMVFSSGPEGDMPQMPQEMLEQLQSRMKGQVAQEALSCREQVDRALSEVHAALWHAESVRVCYEQYTADSDVPRALMAFGQLRALELHLEVTVDAARKTASQAALMLGSARELGDSGDFLKKLLPPGFPGFGLGNEGDDDDADEEEDNKR